MAFHIFVYYKEEEKLRLFLFLLIQTLIFENNSSMSPRGYRLRWRVSTVKISSISPWTFSILFNKMPKRVNLTALDQLSEQKTAVSIQFDRVRSFPSDLYIDSEIMFVRILYVLVGYFTESTSTSPHFLFNSFFSNGDIDTLKIYTLYAYSQIDLIPSI